MYMHFFISKLLRLVKFSCREKMYHCWFNYHLFLYYFSQSKMRLFVKTWRISVLTLSWRRSLSYRNEFIDLQSKSLESTRYENVKNITLSKSVLLNGSRYERNIFTKIIHFIRRHFSIRNEVSTVSVEQIIRK